MCIFGKSGFWASLGWLNNTKNKQAAQKPHQPFRHIGNYVHFWEIEFLDFIGLIEK